MVDTLSAARTLRAKGWWVVSLRSGEMGSNVIAIWKEALGLGTSEGCNDDRLWDEYRLGAV